MMKYMDNDMKNEYDIWPDFFSVAMYIAVTLQQGKTLSNAVINKEW